MNINTVSEDTLINEGILTKEKIRKYPLKLTNLQVVLKIYAVETYQPFTFYIRNMKGVSTEYYLTDKGLQWVYDFFKDKTLDYVRSLFSQLFVRATQDTLQHIDTYPYFNNFRGTMGVYGQRGTKQRALVIRKVGRTERRYEFDTINDARDQLRYWVTLYPIEEFTLYRLRVTEKKGTFKEKIPLFPKRAPNRYRGTKEWTNI